MPVAFRARDRRSWLELLPSNVFERICDFFWASDGTTYCDDPLPLIKALPSLLDLILESKPQPFNISSKFRYVASLVSTKITRANVPLKFSSRTLNRFSFLPSLRYVCLESPTGGTLSWLGKQTTVTEVHLHFEKAISPERLLPALSTLPVESLRVDCRRCGSHIHPTNGILSCAFIKWYSFHDCVNAFFQCCQRLQNFIINACVCNGMEQGAWELPVVRVPDRLRKFEIRGYVPAEIRPQLPAMVTLAMSIDHFSNASKLVDDIMLSGYMLREFQTHIELDDEQIASLAECPNLVHLECHLKEGAELALPDVLSMMTDLNSLSLFWKWSYRKNSFLSPCSGVLLEAIKVARGLTVLRLNHVKLSMGELDMILEETASRLKALEVPVGGQDDLPWTRFESIVRSITKHSTHLDELKIPHESMLWHGKPVLFQPSERTDAFVMMDASKRLLQYHCPFVQIQGFENFRKEVKKAMTPGIVWPEALLQIRAGPLTRRNDLA